MQPLSSMNGDWWSRFRSLLDDQNEWPAVYTFKFIVPTEGLDDVKAVFDGHPVRVRESSKGNYMSLTARVKMDSSEAVVRVYKEVGRVDGVISL